MNHRRLQGPDLKIREFISGYFGIGSEPDKAQGKTGRINLSSGCTPSVP